MLSCWDGKILVRYKEGKRPSTVLLSVGVWTTRLDWRHRRGGCGHAVSFSSQIVCEARRAISAHCFVTTGWRCCWDAQAFHPGHGRPRLPISMQCSFGTQPQRLAFWRRTAYLSCLRWWAADALTSKGMVSSRNVMCRPSNRTMSGRHAESLLKGRQ